MAQKGNGGYQGGRQQAPQQQQQPARKPPVAEFRMGLCKAAVWENVTQDGNGTRLSVSVTRSYKDGQGQWQQAGQLSLNRDDIPLVMEALRQAYAYCYGPKEERQAGQEG